MYQGQKEKFITYFILDEDQHNMICVSSKSISSVAECPLSAGGSSSILIDSSTPKPSQGISSNPHRFKEPCLQNQIRFNQEKNKQKICVKRRKVNPYGSIVTSAGAFEVAEKKY